MAAASVLFSETEFQEIGRLAETNEILAKLHAKMAKALVRKSTRANYTFTSKEAMDIARRVIGDRLTIGLVDGKDVMKHNAYFYKYTVTAESFEKACRVCLRVWKKGQISFDNLVFNSYRLSTMPEFETSQKRDENRVVKRFSVFGESNEDSI